MADDPLKAIVQKMIDAGESEDNIATVIKGYKSDYKPADMSFHQASAPLTEGEPPRTWKDDLGAMMQPLAHPKTLSDIGNLILTPGVNSGTARAMASAVPAAVKAAGSGASKTGLALERAGTSDVAKTLGGAGTIGELAHGDIKGAVIAAGAPTALTASGKALQKLGQVMQGIPGTEGQVARVYQAATNPSLTVSPLNNWEKTFVDSIDTQLSSGRALSGAQKQQIYRIFQRVVGK